MSNNHIRKIIDDDSYEILELDAPEPIIFEANKKYEQHTYNEKNNQDTNRTKGKPNKTRTTLTYCQYY